MSHFSFKMIFLLVCILACSNPGGVSTDFRQQAEDYCREQGGEVIDGRLFGQTQDYCRFSDASACELFDYQRGVCQQGEQAQPF